MDHVRAAGIVAVAITSLFVAGPASPQTVDFSDLMTPQCELAGLVAVPPDGWFNVPFQEAPEGHLGCQMMRTDDDEALVGIMRVRSVSSSAPEYAARALPEGGGAFEEYAGLLASERQAVAEMGFRLAEGSLWLREDVPVAGPGFTDGRAVGVAARIEGNDVPQEAHFLVFRGEGVKYIFSLLTPAESHDRAIYQENVDDFGVVIRTLQPDADRP